MKGMTQPGLSAGMGDMLTVLLVAGGVVAVGIAVWLLLSHRQKKARPKKPKPWKVPNTWDPDKR